MSSAQVITNTLSNGQECKFLNKDLKSRVQKWFHKAVSNILPCQHIFHTYCLLEYSRIMKICPSYNLYH